MTYDKETGLLDFFDKTVKYEKTEKKQHFDMFFSRQLKMIASKLAKPDGGQLGQLT